MNDAFCWGGRCPSALYWPAAAAFGEHYTKQIFLFGFSCGKEENRLLNFLPRQAKQAIYLSKKGKVEGGHKCECLQVFKALVRARVKLELKYYLKMEDLDIFHEMWDWEDILFTIKKTGLLFEDMLIEV